jgi:hypothetical protein
MKAKEIGEDLLRFGEAMKQAGTVEKEGRVWAGWGTPPPVFLQEYDSIEFRGWGSSKNVIRLGLGERARRMGERSARGAQIGREGEPNMDNSSSKIKHVSSQISNNIRTEVQVVDNIGVGLRKPTRETFG